MLPHEKFWFAWIFESGRSKTSGVRKPYFLHQEVDSKGTRMEDTECTPLLKDRQRRNEADNRKDEEQLNMVYQDNCTVDVVKKNIDEEQTMTYNGVLRNTQEETITKRQKNINDVIKTAKKRVSFIDSSATGGLHEMLGTGDKRPKDIDVDISVWIRRGDQDENSNANFLHKSFYRTYLVHVLSTIIMGADLLLDLMQLYNYGFYPTKTFDLFVASIIIMFLVPAGLAIASAIYVTHWVSREVFDCFVGKENFQWGFFIGMCVWCVGTLLAPVIIGIFIVTAFLCFPVMVIIIFITPVCGLYLAWKNIYVQHQYRVFYFIRYTEGLVCSIPQFIINMIFMSRMGYHSATNVASSIFSAISVCQVWYQALGLKEYICKCQGGTCVSLDGYGTLKDVIEGKSRIVAPKCSCAEN